MPPKWLQYSNHGGNAYPYISCHNSHMFRPWVNFAYTNPCRYIVSLYISSRSRFKHPYPCVDSYAHILHRTNMHEPSASTCVVVRQCCRVKTTPNHWGVCSNLPKSSVVTVTTLLPYCHAYMDSIHCWGIVCCCHTLHILVQATHKY